MAALITVAQAREHIQTDLVSAALQRLIDDADAEIVKRHGPHAGPVVENLEGQQKLLFLRRPASAITSVVEYANRSYTTFVTLAVDDYRTQYGGRALERLATGTNWRSTWGEYVVVTYTPAAETARRTRVEIDLVRLATKYAALDREQIGDLMEIHADYDDEREKILRVLSPRVGFA